MKICIVSNYKKNGYGESVRPYYLSVNLLKHGHKILHLCDHEGFEDGIEYIKIKPAVWEPFIIKRLMKFLYLYFKIRTFNPDVIYMHQFNTARWALATRVMPKRRFVFDAHTSVYFELSTLSPQNQETIARVKSIEHKICLNSDYIICASEETREILKATYNLNENKLFVVGNASNITPVIESEVNWKRKALPDQFTCIATLPFDGFLSNELALAYLFEIAALVHAKTDKIKFVVLGGGDKPISPVPNVIYTGYVPNLRTKILNADICLMPYPDNAVCGGARNKFCDFIALGKVVISSPEGMRGMQVLENGKNCIVAHNKSDYADRIIELFTYRDKIKTMEAEIMKVKDLFNWEYRGREVNDIFKKILST